MKDRNWCHVLHLLDLRVESYSGKYVDSALVVGDTA